ncbi:DUF4880 domain-containing protein [Exilibacterium tricleocarpae]|uniref:DUF4880 domain-containing protein n=1 Tax=Exilibacterium tricleocarpae TaxID=2591008 RepID=A0A545TNZ3_9GAMM|nr:FecR domain-containing protein [Exilibacterium tricleocarpae]TQV78908.1 DUF4880 domain-containing protein [Exilibacterium tricleocarpae]
MNRNTRKDKVIPFEEPQSVQAQASAWLARLDGDDISDEDLLTFKQWINQDEAHVAAFEKATAAWGELNILTRLPSALQQKRQQKVRNKKVKIKYLLRNAAVAAIVVLGLLAGLQQAFSPPQPVSYWTAVGEQKTITLPDTSLVQLNTSSRIKVDYSATARAVYLYQGEAHFEVASNPGRPFEVYAGTGRVRAVGTAFSVMLVDNSDDVNVIVTEGVVEVAPEIHPPPVAKGHSPGTVALPPPVASQRIEAGKAALFDEDEVKVVRQIDADEMQRRLAWQEGLLIFSGESLEEVVAQLSRYTDTKILIKSEAARELSIGGQFQVGDTEAIFNALERGFGLQADYVTSSLVYLSYSNER